jgi:hypothetical protein
MTTPPPIPASPEAATATTATSTIDTGGSPHVTTVDASVLPANMSNTAKNEAVTLGKMLKESSWGQRAGAVAGAGLVVDGVRRVFSKDQETGEHSTGQVVAGVAETAAGVGAIGWAAKLAKKAAQAATKIR